MSILVKLQASLEQILNNDLFNVDNYDEMLDMRDSQPFDEQWMEAFNEIESLKNRISFTSKQEDIINAIRKGAYLLVYNRTQSSDLSGYISDDFGLLAEAICISNTNLWLRALLNTYIHNKIPCDILESPDNSFEQLLNGKMKNVKHTK